jgi:hypothetical protein
MKTARTTTLLVIAILLLAWTLTESGCGDKASSTTASAALSGLESFVGAAKLTESTPGTETTAGDVTQVRGVKAAFQVEASDPRASGTAEVTSNYDGRAGVSAQSWGSSVLTNSKGTWVCDAWTGAGATDTGGKSHSFIFNVAKGTGDYEGLVMYVQWHFVEAVSVMVPPSQGIAISGWIEKAK